MTHTIHHTTSFDLDIDAQVRALCTMYQSFASLGEQIQEIEHIIETSHDDESLESTSIEVLRAYVTKLRVSQQGVADAMTFDNPLVWIMYKYEAYKGTSQEIRTVQDFVQHCSHEGCICGKRFIFLNRCLVNLFGADFETLFDSHILLDTTTSHSYIYDVIYHKKYMKAWKKHEYYCRRGKVLKWKNFI